MLGLSHKLALELEDVSEVTEVSFEVGDDVGEEADVDERPVRDLVHDAQVGVVVGALVRFLTLSRTRQQSSD